MSSQRRIAPIAGQDRTPYILGANMTPAAIASAVSLANQGYMRRLCDVLSEQRAKVPHLQAVLATRELAVAGCKWEVLPAKVDGARAGKRAEEIADFVRGVYSRIPRLSNAILHLAGGDYFGRSGLEIEWFRDREGLGVKALHPVHPKRFSYAKNWRIHLWDEAGNDQDPRLGKFPGIDIHEEFPDKFITYEAVTNGAEIKTRQGLGYQLVYIAMFWIWTQRDWMAAAELFAKPWRIGKYEKGAESRDTDALAEALESLNSNAVSILPQGAEVEILKPGDGAKMHEALRTTLNAEISKTVLGQTSTTELGDVGAYASTKIHDLVRHDILDWGGAAMSETFNEYLTKPLVRRQFGPDAAETLCPQFRLITEPEDDIDAELLRAVQLIDRGMPIDIDDARTRYTSLNKPGGLENILRPMGGNGTDTPSDRTEGGGKPADGA